MTVARVRKALLRTATLRLGSMILNIMVAQLAPKLWAASVRARTSMAARPGIDGAEDIG
jgi:hypothetical protein